MSTIADQVIDDPVSGLVFQFRTDESGLRHIHVTLPDGHEYAGYTRDFAFGVDGELVGRGLGMKPPKGPIEP